MFEGTDSVFVCSNVSVTNPSKLRICLCKIPTSCDHRNFDSVNQRLEIEKQS